jgi:hypothetical protein
MLVPFIVYNQLYTVIDPKSRVWMIYHPFLMTMGVIGLPLAAVLQQRLFGYRSNKIHMHAMLISASLVVMGAYVIITHKIDRKESHFSTAHSIVALVWLSMFLPQGALGLIGLDPDNRMGWFSPTRGAANVKRFIYLRRFHTLAGRLILCLGYVVALLGWLKFFATDWVRVTAMSVFLGTLCAITLYDPIQDLLVYSKARRPGLSVGRGA